MKAVVQRVSSAKVIGKIYFYNVSIITGSVMFTLRKQPNDFIYLVNGEEVSSIGKGVLALIGMTKSDSEKDVHYM